MNKTAPQNHLCTVTLLGNLVTKPDIRYQANPVVAVAEFVVATHSQWFDKTSKQTKQWTSYHTVKMIGDVVERTLLHAQKGDIVFIQGHLVTSKKSSREIIHATYAHTYPKGYTHSINQLQCSGTVNSDVRLVTTESNKQLAELTLTINYYSYSPVTHDLKSVELTRPLHVWGSQALYIKEHANIGDEIIVDGKLSYLNNEEKSQFLDAKQVLLQKSLSKS
ncbi:MAG: single-stranded DNA-binding protein [Thalassotalea sp.]